MRWPAFALVLLLPGCFGGDGGAPDGGAEPFACAAGLVGNETTGCSAEEILLKSCVPATFTIELALEAYALPAGFASSPSLTSPQRVAVMLAECEELHIAGQVESAVSYGHVSVLVDAPARGQGGDFDLFDLEVLTDSVALQEWLASAGAPLQDATVSVADAGAVRQASVGGAVSYEALVQFVPTPGSDAGFREAHHSEAGWYVVSQACDYYVGTATAELVPLQGRLTEAALGMPLQGRGSQPLSCDVVLESGRSST